MSKKIIRYLSVLLAVSILFSGISLQITTAFADEADGTTAVPGVESIVSDDSELQDYVAYTAGHKITNKATEEIKLPITEFAVDGADVTVEENVLTWKEGNGKVTWTFEVSQTAIYNLKFLWDATDTGIDPEFEILIDGVCPFDEAENIVLSRLWKNVDTKPREDVQGNQYAQEQVEIDGVITTIVRDSEGATIDPFEFALTAGTHTFTIVKPDQGIKLYDICFTQPEDVKSYEEVSSKYELKDLEADTVTLQGEGADVKTSNAIIPKSNNSDAGMTCWDGSESSKYLTKINYIGGTSWQSSGSRLEWNFEVEESGYYYINMRYKQSDLVNGESWRWLKIDGKTPFEEAKSLKFPYGTSWEYYTIGEQDEENEVVKPYYIYLEAGKTHTLSMEVTVGEISEYFHELSQIFDLLGDKYMQIVMITGETPDLSRDYDLNQQIPDLTEVLTSCRDRLEVLANKMTDGTGQASQAVSAMNNMKRVIENMLNVPYLAQQYVSDYYTNYSSIGSWLYDMIRMPLAIDEIQIIPKGSDIIDKEAGFFDQLAFDAVRLISSFTNDYSLTSADKDDENTIRLWVNWGQDQAAALNSLIQDTFTPNPEYYYNGKPINVQVEIVNASLINGILADNYPDMSLQMARTEPVNLGIRGALADLRQFDDFEEVITRFQNGSDLTTGAVAPYSYGDSTYALPDTQNFMLMFYRTDILDDLGLLDELGDPNQWTWDDFLYSATIIQRNNMSVYVPFTQITTSTTVNAGIGNLHLYPTLMWQHGLNIYNSEGNATAIAEKKALDVFEKWTDFYLEYSFLKEADFYNRMRVGTMPLGIAPYTTYMTFYATAPEIRGRWSIAMVPGTEDENGNVNRSVAGSGSGCAIIKESTKQEQAWQFLKWWTSAETQQRYNENLQSILGMIGRTAVSNTEAFSNLAWDKDDLKILQAQWAQVKEVQEVPGSYDVTRAIDQAYWTVLEDDAKVKDAVTKWAKIADREIERKIEEYPNAKSKSNS